MQYMQDRLVPTPTSNTNGALAQYALAVKQALDLSNADKAALRDWASTVTK